MNTRTSTLIFTTIAVGALCLGACEDRNTPTAPTTPPTGATGPTPAPRTGTGVTATGSPAGGVRTNDVNAPPAADNTARNKDHDVAPTAQDQGETQGDRNITAEIRKGVIALEGLSTNASNCKIITRNGVVTLRGPVASAAERDSVERVAKAVAGVTSVVNELEVKP